MKACWMFMILLSCRLSRATDSHSICACKEQLKIVCVPPGHNVSVPCPKLIDKEVTLYLYKEEELFYDRTCTPDKNTANCKSQYTSEYVELHENTENKSVNFMLTRVNASSYGIYRCERVIVYPPPLLKEESTLRILLRVEGHQCKVSKTSPPTNKPAEGEPQNQDPLWVWVLGLALAVLYGVTVTIIAVIIRVKWSRSDSQSDYMNTKPKAGRDHKKKRGVQNPLPHF
ncbi:T-cell-specific surface glycoprotein CD28 [Centropristis striata]|uniref:T-cell-specific surface glycoprotein CD28 n=1 Tax=Centropristis striata TaxID=184440 RepID=UPI0027E09164|nr:T-cell-specific surface glycoprotein CD28 [Centropristis striata]